MGRVLIVSKTKMANDNVCIGGVDIDKKRSVRLLDENGFHESISECPFNIWEIWEISYLSSNQRPAPHIEDVNVISREKKGVLKNEFKNTIKLSQLLRQSNVPKADKLF